MPSFKVVVTDHVFESMDIEREIIEQCNAELIITQCKSVDELVPFTEDADVILNTYLGFLDEKFFSTLKKCRAIVRHGIGLDTIDIKSATRHGIMVVNIPDYCIDEVSDHAVACMLALIRKLMISDRHVRLGEWNLGYVKPIHRISSLTVGIVGMGRIGRLSAKKSAVFGPRLIFTDPYVKDDVAFDGINVKKVDLEELVSESDVILIHAPATPETHYMFNKELFRLMKRKPIIINCARGNLIDNNALISALEDGQISGAALDVIDDVPPIDKNSPLMNFENLILTPHSAWYSEEALISLQRMAAEEVVRILKGEKPKSLVNPDVLKVLGLQDTKI